MKFTTKRELITQAKKDGACKAGIQFAESCKDLQEIFDTINTIMIVWCLMRDYEQFAEHCDLSKFSGWNWRKLLHYKPQYSDRCDWGKLSGEDWSCLLISQPQFADRCDWEKLNCDDLDFLLKSQPQLAAYRK